MTLALCGSFSCGVSLAATPEPLDTDFLDYLANCEGKDDNWTVIASDKERKKTAVPPAKPPAKPTEPARQPEVQP
jgi:hypothetical protein